MNAMKKNAYLAAFAVLTITLLALPVTAFAGAFCTHGHSGHVQNLGFLSSGPTYLGGALIFDQYTYKSNWVHFSVPSEVFKNMRYLAIDFKVTGSGASIDEVHVYVGRILIKKFTNLNWSGDWQPQILDLGQDFAINLPGSVGISVNTETLDYIGHFEFDSVCAEFH